MKKIILLLTVLTLGVIACDKNELGMDMDGSSIKPIENVVAKSEASDEDIYSVVDMILNGTYYPSKKGQAGITGKGNDYVKVYVFSDNSMDYLILNDETNDDLCVDAAVTPFDMFFDNSAGDGSVLTVEAPEGTVRLSLTGDFAGFFDAGLNSIRQYDSATDTAVSVDFDSDNAVTFN